MTTTETRPYVNQCRTIRDAGRIASQTAEFVRRQMERVCATDRN